jgi:hypothetical protein
MRVFCMGGSSALMVSGMRVEDRNNFLGLAAVCKSTCSLTGSPCMISSGETVLVRLTSTSEDLPRDIPAI